MQEAVIENSFPSSLRKTIFQNDRNFMKFLLFIKLIRWLFQKKLFFEKNFSKKKNWSSVYLFSAYILWFCEKVNRIFFQLFPMISWLFFRAPRCDHFWNWRKSRNRSCVNKVDRFCKDNPCERPVNSIK